MTMEYIKIGIILKPHGVKGAVKVQPFSRDPLRFKQLQQAYLKKDNTYDSYQVENVSFQKQNIILSLNMIDSFEKADQLRNQYLYLPVNEVAALPADHYYLFDLIDVAVYLTNQTYLGKIKDVLLLPANDVFVIERESQELLLPALKELIVELDLKAKKMIVKKMPGLTEEFSDEN